MKFKCDKCKETVEIGWTYTSRDDEYAFEIRCRGWGAYVNNRGRLVVLCPKHKEKK